MPPWLNAQLEFEAKLREVSEASQQVKAEIEDSRRPGGKRPGREAATTRPPKEESKDAPEPQAGGQGQPPGSESPCFHKETRGSGAFRNANAPPARMKCTYQCGDIQVSIYVWGNSGIECQKPSSFELAAREAARKRAMQERGD